MKPSMILALCLAVGLAGCVTRPGPEALQEVRASAPDARFVTVYVATTRERETPGANVFTSNRAPELNYAEFTISIPPGHEPGKVEWPKERPNPAKSFAIVRQDILDRKTFEGRVKARGNGSRTGVFVHGFNQNFQEALFRLAQITADANVEGTPVLFAWPSEAHITGYVADKDAVTASRDSLAGLLADLTKGRPAGDVTLVAHSMGSWLTVETLRQLRLTGRDDVLNRLDVILAAPDIDVDVFRTQMEVIGSLRRPMTILVSSDDRALSVSSRIAGKRPRLGALDINDPRIEAAAREANVQIIDISALDASNALNHDRYVNVAKLYPQIAQAEGPEGVRRAGAFVFNAIGFTLSAPFNLAGRAISGE